MNRPRALRSTSAWYVIVTAAFATLLGACSGDGAKSTAPSPSGADTVAVFTPGNVFSPTSAEIRVGGTITWNISASSDGTGHNVIFTGNVSGKPADITVVKGVQVSRTFTKAGTYPYSCTVHPGMDGDVVVK